MRRSNDLTIIGDLSLLFLIHEPSGMQPYRDIDSEMVDGQRSFMGIRAIFKHMTDHGNDTSILN